MKGKIGKKYLPIGTVVMLKGGSKRVMITGFCVSTENQKNKVWDYSGCMYPEGIISHAQILLFDHEQIVEVFHMGLVDDEETTFKQRLEQILDNKATNKSSKGTTKKAPSKAAKKNTKKTTSKTAKKSVKKK